MKNYIPLLATPLLFISCANTEKAEDTKLVTSTTEKKDVTHNLPTNTNKEQNRPSEPQYTRYETRTENPYGQLPDAYAPATDAELKSNSAPVDTTPNHVTSPPKVD